MTAGEAAARHWWCRSNLDTADFPSQALHFGIIVLYYYCYYFIPFHSIPFHLLLLLLLLLFIGSAWTDTDGVRMPVESMSMPRLDGHGPGIGYAGELQGLVQLGDELVCGEAGGAIRSPGFRLITVSNISGAPGRWRSARPCLAGTEACPETLEILFWVCSSSAALLPGQGGRVVGM